MWSLHSAKAFLSRTFSRQYSLWKKQKTALTEAEAEMRDNLAAQVAHRPRAWCEHLEYTPDLKSCFDLENAVIVYGGKRDQRFIRSFLYTHYWPREPSINNLWMALNSPYLHLQTEKLSLSGDRFIAYQLEPRTQECKMVGLVIGNKICPWTVDEIEEWALQLEHCEPEQARVAFQAHILRETDLINKYKVPYIYDLEVVATAAEVTGLGLGELLLKVAITRAMELQHPILQILAKSAYVAKLCDRLGMKNEWSMKYTDFKNYLGRPLFYNRTPHHTLTCYTRLFNKREGSVPDACDSPRLHQTYVKMISKTPVPCPKPRTCFTRDNMHYAGEVKKDRDLYRTGTCTCYKNIFQKTFLSECPPECYRDPMTKNRPDPRCP